MNRRRALVGGTAVMVAMVAGPAVATGASHTVSVGGTPLTTSTTFTAATSTTGANVHLSFKNNSGSIINWNCSRATAAGTIQPGVDVASITAVSFVGCTAPLGAMTNSQVGPWKLHSPHAYTAAANETIVGHLDDFEQNWQNAANPIICKFTIRGAGAAKGLANVALDESTQSLAVAETGYTGNLTLQNVIGCGNQLQNGNAVDLSMAMAVTVVGGALNVTS